MRYFKSLVKPIKAADILNASRRPQYVAVRRPDYPAEMGWASDTERRVDGVAAAPWTEESEPKYIFQMYAATWYLVQNPQVACTENKNTRRE